MKLKIILPTKILLEIEVTKVTAEAENGCFCLLPHHIDYVTALVPGLLAFVAMNGQEHFLAVDSGILVKCGMEVLVSTSQAVLGGDLGMLKQTIEQEFQVLDERETKMRSVLAKLEANLVRQFVELGG
ncbi:MAG: F0F1 ATP synthase subunit epsilon [Gloeobacterales cyanobacterium]